MEDTSCRESVSMWLTILQGSLTFNKTPRLLLPPMSLNASILLDSNSFFSFLTKDNDDK